MSLMLQTAHGGFGLLANAPGSSGALVFLEAASGARFRNPTAVGSYPAVLRPNDATPSIFTGAGKNAELVLVTALSGDMFTVTRNYDGNGAVTALQGYQFFYGPTMDGNDWTFRADSGASAILYLDTFGSGSVFGALTVRHARGTPASPSALQADDFLGAIAGIGYAATHYSDGAAQIRLMAGGNWSDTSQPSYIDFLTTPVGSVGTSAAVGLRLHSTKILSSVGGVNIGPNALTVPPMSTALLTANANAVTPVWAPPIAEVLLAYVGGADATIPISLIEAWGGVNVFPALVLRKARGTGASPSAVQAGEIMGAITQHGYGATTYGGGGQAQIRFVAGAANWTDTDQSAYIEFYVTPTGTLTIQRAGAFNTDGSLDVLTGYRVNGAATSGHVLRGNGSNFIDAALAASDIASGAALTKTDDTNVTLTLGGTPASALLKAAALTLGWTGLLGLARGGTAADISATGGAGKYLKQASAGAAITVASITAAEITSGAAFTKTDDTNVTATLGGTPTAAVLAAMSLTLGWTGTLAVSRGGIGAGTLASNGILYGNGTGAVLALAVNATATRKFLRQVSSGAPAWDTLTSADVTNSYMFGAHRSAATQTIGNNAFAIVGYDTEDFDPNNNYDPTTFTYTVPVTGKYAVSALLQFTTITVTAAAYIAAIFVNGTEKVRFGQWSAFASETARSMSFAVDVLLSLTAADTVDVRFFQNTGGSAIVINAGALADTCLYSVEYRSS